MTGTSLLIFCPTCQRFVGDKAKCPYCDWVRPAQASRVGQSCWETLPATDETLPGAPVYPARITAAAGMLLLPTETGEVVAYEADTGREVWRHVIRDDHRLRAHAVEVWGDIIVIGCENLTEIPTKDRALLAWRLANGADVWSFPTSGDSLSAPLVHDHVAYFTSSEPRVHALDLKTRQPRWETPGLAWSPDAPVLYEQTLVVPTRGPQAAAYSVETGERLWTFEVEDKEREWLNYRPVITPDLVYLAGWRNRLYAVERTTGRLRWKVEVDRGLTCPPVLAGNKLLIGVKDYRQSEGGRKSGYGLYALAAATGDIVWKLRTDKHVNIPPAVSGEVVLLGADDRRLRALNLADGAELWQIALPDKLRAGPTVLGDRVVVGRRDGALNCVWWQVERVEAPDPQALLAQGKQSEAAAALALRGDYADAACLFEQQGEWRAAAAVWREIERLDEAAACYVQAHDYVPALDLYRQLNNRVAEARILVQQEKHAEAAVIYEELGDIDLAVQEFAAGGRAVRAAELLSIAGRHNEAAEYYRQAQEPDHAAEALIKAGDYSEAAEIYLRLNKTEAAVGVLIQGGLLVDAAQLNEQLGHKRSAAELYERANLPERALDIYEEIQDWQRVIDLAEVLGKWATLAEALRKAGQPMRAAEAYEQAELFDMALEAYESQGMWDRVEGLAARVRNWSKQAYALTKRGLLIQAGEAYELAAEQAARNQRAPEAAAQLYEKAADCFKQEEQWPRYNQCWKRACQLNHWPYIQVRVTLRDRFLEGEQNHVELGIINQGAGDARNIQVVRVSSRFEMDAEETEKLRLVPGGTEKTLRLAVQPKPAVRGKAILGISLIYQNMQGRSFDLTIEYQTEVFSYKKAEMENRHAVSSDTTPHPIIIVQGGDVALGDLVKGDQIAAGGQKGDKIEITRGEQTVRVTETEAAATRPAAVDLACPQCGKSYLPTEKYCQSCGAALT